MSKSEHSVEIGKLRRPASDWDLAVIINSVRVARVCQVPVVADADDYGNIVFLAILDGEVKAPADADYADAVIGTYFAQFPKAHTRPVTVTAWAQRNGWPSAYRERVMQRMRQMAVDGELTRDEQGLYRMVTRDK